MRASAMAQHGARSSLDPHSLGHELPAAFLTHGLPLSAKLCEMLDERPEHRSERRGCGYTQATRVLANVINAERSNREALGHVFHLSVLESLAQPDGQQIALSARRELLTTLRYAESRMLAELLLGCVLRDGVESQLATPALQKIPIGSCPLAEEYFLEVAYGRVRRGGSVNVVIAANGTPALLEKCGLGEDHSCISVAKFSIHGVDIPIGALIAIQRDESSSDACRRTRNGCGVILRGSQLTGLRFLRLTTLCVPPGDRKRAFSAHFEQQIRAGLFSPETTTIEQLARYAREQAS